jgi:DNA-3-methyladenine glycosylase II
VRDARVNWTRHGRMSDDEIVSDVATVRGIGPWTAQMYLISTMSRPDVWPIGDYGVRSRLVAAARTRRDHQREGLARRRAKGSKAARTSVAWYCWEAVHWAKAAK